MAGRLECLGEVVTCRRGTGSGGESWVAISGFWTYRLTDTYERAVDQLRNGSEFGTVVRLEVRFRSWKLIAGRRICVADVALETYTVLWRRCHRRDCGVGGQDRGEKPRKGGLGGRGQAVRPQRKMCHQPPRPCLVPPTLRERECGVWSVQVLSWERLPFSKVVFFPPSVLQ